MKKAYLLVLSTVITLSFFMMPVSAYNNDHLAKLKMGSIAGVKGQGFDLSNAEIGNFNLYRSDFSRANFQNVRFNKTMLQAVKFNEANLDHARFTNISFMTDMSFVKAKLSYIRVEGCFANNINFSGADLVGADLRGLNANIGRSIGKFDFTGANLAGANLSGLDLTLATFTGANLYKTNLTGAKLNSNSLNGVRYDPPKKITNVFGTEIYEY